MLKIIGNFVACAVLLLGFSLSSVANVSHVVVVSKGHGCPWCNNMVEMKLKKVPNTKSVEANLRDSSFDYTPIDGVQPDLMALKKAVQKSGYSFRYIALTVDGVVGEAGRIQDPASGNIFQLSPAEWEGVKSRADQGKVSVRGRAYPDAAGSPIRFEVIPDDAKQ